MVGIDLSGASALVTGGTQGIGKAAALELSRAGAKVYVTYKWGTVDETSLSDEFEDYSGARPTILNADVSVDEDTTRLLAEIRETTDQLDIFISNVGFAAKVETLDDYSKRSLFKTFEYSSWPLVEYSRRIKDVFGAYPKRVIAISSDGPDHYYRGYDYVSAAKALLEHFARYLAVHLQPHGSMVNVIRFGTVKTPSFDAIFGNEFFEFVQGEGLDVDLILTPEACGKSILGLASGLFDAMNGQVLTVDYGLPFQDNLMMRFQKWKESAEHT
jgi:NAD(P)-dependent dehydrogenase (short-subunit alcohol dehydrogenase family)